MQNTYISLRNTALPLLPPSWVSQGFYRVPSPEHRQTPRHCTSRSQMAAQTKYSLSLLHAGSKLPACVVNSAVMYHYYCTHKVGTMSHSQADMGEEKEPRNEADAYNTVSFPG